LSLGIRICFAPGLSFTGPDLSTKRLLDEVELSGSALAVPVPAFLDVRDAEALLSGTP